MQVPVWVLSVLPSCVGALELEKKVIASPVPLEEELVQKAKIRELG